MQPTIQESSSSSIGTGLHLNLQVLRPDQYTIAAHPARFKILACGRRWGKTLLCTNLAATCAHMGGYVAWIVPVYSNSEVPWNALKKIFEGLKRLGMVKIYEKNRKIELLYSGGYIYIFSADKPESILSNAFNLAIMDEAARIKEKVWKETIQPTLADWEGDAILPSTPCGKNWYYEEYLKGKKDGVRYQSWKCPSSDNPLGGIRREMEEARKNLSKKSFEQEWLAEFTDDGGEVFRNLDACSRNVSLINSPAAFRQYIMGIDQARYEDYLAITIFDVKEKRQVFLQTYKNVAFDHQENLIYTLYQTWKPMQVVIETNYGTSLAERLGQRGLPILEVRMTNPIKQQLVDKLIVAFDNGEIKLLPLEEQIAQFENFECTRTSTGLLKYQAPPGRHDDIVIAVALAWNSVHECSVSPILGLTDMHFYQIAENPNQMVAFLAMLENQAALAFVQKQEFFSKTGRSSLHINDLRLISLDAKQIVDTVLGKRVRLFGIDESQYGFIANEWREQVNRLMRDFGQDIKTRIRPITREKDVSKRVLQAIQGPIQAGALSISPHLVDTACASQLYVTDSVAIDAVAGCIELSKLLGN